MVSEGWYIACPSDELKRGETRGIRIGSQYIVIYRGYNGSTYALDGFCPHMGADLNQAKVIENTLRCKFHHWRYDGEGRLIDIPCQNHLPRHISLRHYPTKEKFGCIWLWSGESHPPPIINIQGLYNNELAVKVGKPYQRGCHHHITMINGIDAQHLNTVHDLNVDLSVDIERPAPHHLRISLSGPIVDNTPRGKLLHRLLGGRYRYTMDYVHGTLGLLTMMQDVKLLGRFRIPELYLIYAYTPNSDKTTTVTPLYITTMRRGPLGRLISSFLLSITRVLFHFLKEEDGSIYENIRFNTTNFLKIDGPVAKYVSFINQMKPSIWSTQTSAEKESPQLQLSKG